MRDENADAPMCAADSDCASGKTCDEGLCWGNPPARQYAALLMPPPNQFSNTAAGLVPTELPLLEIDASGTIQNLSFAAPVTLRGRVVLSCGDEQLCGSKRSIEAQIQVKRPSRIPGAPPYIVRASSQAGIEEGAASFVLPLPPSEPGELYEVTIVPSLNPDAVSGSIPAELAPPAIFSIAATEDRDDLVWTVGEPDRHLLVRGRVVDAVGAGIPERRVFALGPSNELAMFDRRSSLSTSDKDGYFALRIPIEAAQLGGIDIVVEPKTMGTAPTLRVSNVALGGETMEDIFIDIGDLHMPGYSDLRTFTLPVHSINGGGDEVPVAAAEVRVETVLEGTKDNVVALFTNQTFTDNAGNAQIALIPGSERGNRLYQVHVVPPAETEYASIYGHELSVGSSAQGGVLLPVTLQHRIPVSGTLVTAQGKPALGATVAAALSVGLRWSLEPTARAHVDTLQLPEDTTDHSGRFVLWLEEGLFGTPAAYDLTIRPSDLLAPQWSLEGIDMSNRDASGTVDLGTVKTPDAAYVRGIVLSPGMEPVPGAEVRLYELAEDHSPCTTRLWPEEGECLVPPQYRGPAHSRDDGQVTLVLPDLPL